MEKINIFGYSRKSPDDKESTEVSIDNQNRLIKSICKEKEWNLKKIFTDKNISGGDRYRKNFTIMISESIEIKDNNKNYNIFIVVKDQSRFCRDSAFFKDTLKDLDVRGIKVFSISKPGFLNHEDLGDNVNALMGEQKIVEGKKYSEISFKQKMEDQLPSIPAPYGYKYNKKKEWVIDVIKSKKVSQVCLDFEKGIKLKETLSNLKINKSLYYRILKNVKKGLYSGYIIYERKYRDSNKIIVRTEEVKYLGHHPHIISQELFDEVNKI